jgi:SAM-dependent methyltransferase
MNIWPVVKGLLTFIPGMHKFLSKRGTGGTNSANYCYEVWLKHLTFLWENGLRSIPGTIAELGPGDSLGVGLAAMLSGANNYYALDVVRHSNIEINLKIFDELVVLFKARAGSPSKGWPDYSDYLNGAFFPSHILNDELLDTALSKRRITAIRNAIQNPEVQDGEITIKYMVPWSDASIIKKDTVDVIFSHAVLEHIADLENTYQALYAWLKPNGMMSHQIDFTSHSLTAKWNGYRVHSELLWKIIMGKRDFMINREPYSVHKNLIIKNGFTVLCDLKNYRTDGIERSELSSYWKDITDDDLACSGAFIQARK